MEYVIRRATEADSAVIQELNQALFFSEHESNHDDILLLHWPQTDAGKEYFRKALTDDKKCVIIAERDNKAVGYLIGSAYNRFDYRTHVTGELENMLVISSVRGKGIGKALVNALKVWFTQKGITRMYVSAYAKNKKAIAFYESCGFLILDVGLEMKL